MKSIGHEARLALAAVLVAIIVGSDGNQARAFVGPSVGPGSTIANTPPSSCAAKKSGVLKAPATENGTMPESLSRRMQARRARSKPKIRTGSTATDSQQRQSTEESEKGDDVGNLFRYVCLLWLTIYCKPFVEMLRAHTQQQDLSVSSVQAKCVCGTR